MAQFPRYQGHLHGSQRRRIDNDSHAVAGVRDVGKHIHVLVFDVGGRVGG
jgi:hypothetical protein